MLSGVGGLLLCYALFSSTGGGVECKEVMYTLAGPLDLAVGKWFNNIDRLASADILCPGWMLRDKFVISEEKI